MISTAIIPVAGFGTRRLPITKAIEKCMLPVGNRPIVDYVVEDCLQAGVTDIIFVVSEQSQQLRTYYGHNTLLEEYLGLKQKGSQLEEILALAEKARFHYVVQGKDQPYGTAVPVVLATDICRHEEQVLVVTGDDFIFNADGSSEIKRLIDAVAKSDSTSGLLAVHVPREQVSKYGVIEMQEKQDGSYFKRIVEQPTIEEAPSNLINTSKYVFDKQMLEYVKEVMSEPPAPNGEYQVIKALNKYVASGRSLTVVPAKGEYQDGGSLEGWLRANNRVLGI